MGPDGVRVNVVCPLAMTESLEQWRDAYPDLFAKTIQGIPLGRFADPEKDIGRVCVFLASDDAVLCHGRNHHAPGRQRSASVRKSKIIQRETEEIPLPFFF